jgi:iron complex outermembrane receptor protein
MKTQFVMGAAVLAMCQMMPARADEATDGLAGTASDILATDEIVVIGDGQTRQVQTVSAVVLETLTPGTSPIKLVQRLPGVAFSGADSFGAYEWAVRINIRGFNQNQLGFTLDGVPLGDMSYGNHNGLHISRALISENLARVELSQGSGALDLASSNQLGGGLRFFSRDPSETFGGIGAITSGSDNTLRGFARLDTGEIGDLGLRAWLSVLDGSMDKYKGEGEQNQRQFAIKVVQPIGAAAITGYWNRSERRENDYQDMSLEMIRRLGYNWDNFGNSQFVLSQLVADIAHNRGDTGQPITNAAAGTVYPVPIRTADDAYLNASGLRDDDLGYIALDLPLGDTIDVRLQAYLHNNLGQGLWGTPYVISPNATVAGATTANAPLSIRTTEYDIQRQGVLGSVAWRIANHEIEAGFWFEQNDFEQFRRFYALDRARLNRDFLEFQSNPFFTQWGYAFDTRTMQFFVQDTWDVTEDITLNFGFRSLNVENEVRTLVINNAAPVVGTNANLTGSISTEDSFLPQAGIRWALDDQTELFGAYAENVSAYVSAATAGPFASRSQANVDEVRRRLNPESARSFEAGVRHRRENFQVGATLYRVDFADRLLAISQGPGIVGNAPILSNVGDVRTQGVEFVGQFDLTDKWSAFGSFTMNNSEYRSDVRNAAGVVLARTGGKLVVNTPEHLGFGEIAYDDGALFGQVSAAYTGARFFTFENDGGRVDATTIVDATLGYRLSGNAFLDGLEIQANVNNLFDTDYVGTLGTNGFVNRGDSQTLVTGAPRQVFVTLRKSF